MTNWRPFTNSNPTSHSMLQSKSKRAFLTGTSLVVFWPRAPYTRRAVYNREVTIANAEKRVSNSPVKREEYPCPNVMW